MENTINQSAKTIYSYSEYRALTEQLLAENKTTGENQSEAFLEYTKLNQQRMKRWDKKAEINEELKAQIAKIDTPQRWLVLTEAWCGDAAHNIPVIAKMAELNENIELQLILRDENLDIMDQYLTNGGRSIPKLVAFNENNEELFTWGPRPNSLQELYKKMKEENTPAEESKTIIQQWYNKNKTQELQTEFVQLLNS